MAGSTLCQPKGCGHKDCSSGEENPTDVGRNPAGHQTGLTKRLQRVAHCVNQLRRRRRHQPTGQDGESFTAGTTSSAPHPQAFMPLVVGRAQAPSLADDRAGPPNRASAREQVQGDHPGVVLSSASGSAIKRITAGVRAPRRRRAYRTPTASAAGPRSAKKPFLRHNTRDLVRPSFHTGCRSMPESGAEDDRLRRKRPFLAAFHRS